MPKRKYMARGWKGLKKGGKLEKDLVSMSDEKRRERESEKLEVVAGDNLKRAQQGKKSRSVVQYSADYKIKQLRGKAADLRAKAQKVEGSGTGNKAAAATYRKAADEALARVKKLQTSRRKK